MQWQLSHRADPKARELADRHYNRQKPGTPQFVPPGRCLVLYAQTDTVKAFWVTSWPFAVYVKHQWAGAWVCSAFRNEGAGVASEMIREAVAATKAFYGDPPCARYDNLYRREKGKANNGTWSKDLGIYIHQSGISLCRQDERRSIGISTFARGYAPGKRSEVERWLKA